ncbi:MAG: ubiquinol oxidase subunit II [Candidatus Devosia phytovorans]|uniref:Ubiquinol oxidase polypeptide II n=1 Tax=Candidatus Devosia phytovorans TaxID=3121372 RepID=A0AAJ6B255_9HYPH|nr:ubiquinol oxidase subunit II [Devosia sp.]WEK06441.1 MAG: ubiquinol oxidase subunit II [Devosia sp.]
MSRFAKSPAAVLTPFLLAGCTMAPSGDVAMQQRDLILIATFLMLLIIIPVMVLVVVFARKYRHGNTKARYEPDWDHSTQLELVIWAAPLLIIICLGAVTWVNTHLLDPYRELGRIRPGEAVAANVEPLLVQVVALDWKWLFIYPQYDVATINELVAPVDRPIKFELTSDTVMNAFYVPSLAGMIYAMPGMQTQLHAVINEPGEYKGIAAHYSGHGFSGMHFKFHGVDNAGFDQWVADVRGSGDMLNRQRYFDVEARSENNPVQHFAGVENGLFTAIVNMCVELDKMCQNEMMAIDASGGSESGAHNMAPALYSGGDARLQEVLGVRRTYVGAICTPEEAIATTAAIPSIPAPNPAPLKGLGLNRPSVMTADHREVFDWLAGKVASIESNASSAL